MSTIKILPDLGRDPANVVRENAFLIASSMSPESFQALKSKLGLSEPFVLGPQTLKAFEDAFVKSGYDLTTGGVSGFKAAHKLADTGSLKGVIGPTTANVYADELLKALTPGDGHRHVNQAGLDLVKEFEGCAKFLPDGRLTAYLDAVRVPTIGYGHTHGVHLGMIITVAEAEAYLREDLHSAEDAVAKAVKVNLTENEFSALVSFVFNLGPGALLRSTLLAELNRGVDKTKVANEFGKFVHAGGKVLSGLVRRRAAEKALFLQA